VEAAAEIQRSPAQVAASERLRQGNERRSAIIRQLKELRVPYHGRMNNQTLEDLLVSAKASPSSYEPSGD
jgi:hypothetical protein